MVYSWIFRRLINGILSVSAATIIIGLALGFCLYQGEVGFSAAYRNALKKRDVTGVLGQIIMVAAALILFTPLLTVGEFSGHRFSGAWAPASLQVVIGAFLFGIGMQLGGACASGTLFTLGGGSLRMAVTLVFFCLGAFIGSLHMGWWGQLPSLGVRVLGDDLGYGTALLLQLGVLGLAYWGLLHWGTCDQTQLFKSFKRPHLSDLIKPWPLLVSTLMLAILNTATLVDLGHPWSIVWGFTLWGAKIAQALGWDYSTSAFWTAPFQQNALKNPISHDSTSVMNITIIIGAFMAAVLSGKFKPGMNLPFSRFAASLIGGLLMGYGARLAYGCNIGAFFSGVASGSLHGWIWIIFALIGTKIGIHLRPYFRL